MSILVMENVCFAYEDQEKALVDVSISINKGEKIAILGNNGAGKSTFFLCLNGILKPKSGRVLLDGEPVLYTKKGLGELRRKVGIVFQDADDQIIAATVEQEVSFGPMNLGISKEMVQEKTNSAIKYMNLEDLRKRPPHYLSGGEKKRVSIADIVAMDSEIILFDEPTASLDPKNTMLLESTLNRLNEQEKAVVVATHDIDFAWRWADRVILFHEGEILQDANAQEVFLNKDAVLKAGIRLPIVYEIVGVLAEQNILKMPEKMPKSMIEFKELVVDEKKERE